MSITVFVLVLWLITLAFRCFAGALPMAEPTTRILHIDNFNLSEVSGLYTKRENMLGGYHGSWAQRPSFVNMHLEVADRCGDSGTSLGLKYHRDAGSCGWYTLLKGADATTLNALRFKIRGRIGGEELRIGFCDTRMLGLEMEPAFAGTVDTYLTAGITTNWQEVEIPIETYYVNMQELASFSLNFEYDCYPNGAASGTIYIDDLAFE